jgi:aromatic-L-amino-acid decarboxylase
VTPEFLEGKPRGLASGPWLHDYGLQTSRAFRALKIWMALKEHGINKFARLIDQNIAQAKYLSDLIMREPLLELAAPTSINIACFRFRPKDLAEEAVKPVNMEIMLRLQEQGIAAISDTTIHGGYCLRVAINNHRTKRCDLDLLIAEILRLGAQMHPSTVIPAKAGTP